MPTLQFDLSGKGGLTRNYWGDINKTAASPQIRVNTGDTEMAQGVFNPFTRYGFMSPSSNAYTSITPQAGAYGAQFGSSQLDDVATNHYYAERSTQIWKAGAGLDVTNVGLARTIAGATFTDLEIYQVNGVRKMFASYQKASGGDIALFDLNATWNDTFLSGTTSGAFNTGTTNNVFMRKADNGFMYIFDGNSIHKFDGTIISGGANGTATPNVIVFPIFFQSVDAIDYRGDMYVGIMQRTSDQSVGTLIGNFSTDCGVYIWDRQSTVVKMEDYIPLYGVKEIRRVYISPNGDLRIITIASDSTVQIQRYNGSDFDVIQELAPGAYPQFPDALRVEGQLTWWVGADGYIYAHGSYTPTQKEDIYRTARTEILLQLGQVVSGPQAMGCMLWAGSSGASASLSSGYRTDMMGFNISYIANGGTVNFKRWYPFGSGTIDSQPQNAHAGNIYTSLKSIPFASRIKCINVYMAPTLINDSQQIGTVNIYFNMSSTPWASKPVLRSEAARGYKHIEVNQPNVNVVQLGITFATNVSLGPSDFAPYLALVEYEIAIPQQPVSNQAR